MCSLTNTQFIPIDLLDIDKQIKTIEDQLYHLRTNSRVFDSRDLNNNYYVWINGKRVFTIEGLKTYEQYKDLIMLRSKYKYKTINQ